MYSILVGLVLFGTCSMTLGQIVPPQPVPGVSLFGQFGPQAPGLVRDGPVTPFLTGNIIYGTCYFNNTYSPIQGRVDMRQDLSVAPPLLDVKVRVKGLPQTWMSERERAMHVHQWGDISRNCYNTGPHYDRDNSFHGPPTATDSSARHDGDLGNFRQSNNGVIDATFSVQNLLLAGDDGILGRSFVLKEGRDDLGRGNTPVSLQTGNSGQPIACCVIGLADAHNWNNDYFSTSGNQFNPLGPNLNINNLG